LLHLAVKHNIALDFNTNTGYDNAQTYAPKHDLI